MSCVSPPEGMLLLPLAMLVSLALCVPRRPVLHRSAALVVSLLYGKQLTKLSCTTQLGPGLGAVVGAGSCSVGARALPRGTELHHPRVQV